MMKHKYCVPNVILIGLNGTKLKDFVPTTNLKLPDHSEKKFSEKMDSMLLKVYEQSNREPKPCRGQNFKA